MDAAKFDEQVARLDKIADLAQKFVLVRLVNMRGVNLQVFDFDYDLTWAGLFLNAHEHVYGRFGGREPASPDTYNTLAGLRWALASALEQHRAKSDQKPPKKPEPPLTVEQYPAAKKLRDNACIHCHQVYDFRREQLLADKQWKKDDAWVYPLPDPLGLRLDPECGPRVREVVKDSPAHKLGMQKGDHITSIEGLPIASFSDVQYALHQAGAKESIRIEWQREGEKRPSIGDLALPKDWRTTDLSWRGSTRRLGPPPCVDGEDLSAEDKKKLGLADKALAFRIGAFLPTEARQAGLRSGDVIVGVDGKKLEMTAGQFGVYMRLNYQSGDQVTYNVLRGKEKLDIALTLPSRPPF